MNNRRNHTTFFRSLSVALLLSVYVGAILFDGFHSIFDHHHHDAAEHCSIEVEASPCHQKIYHNNHAQGCDHNTHLIPERYDCDLCDAMFAKFYSSKKQIEQETVFNNPDFIPFFKELNITSFFYPSISLRGPPQIA